MNPLLKLSPGERVVYYSGHLASDCAVQGRVGENAKIARRNSNEAVQENAVILFQKRIDPHNPDKGFDYIAVGREKV